MSLSFVGHETAIDLSNCDREPIHIPGQIQAHGALFAIDRHSWLITQVSSNVATYFGRAPEALLGSNFKTLLEPHDQAAIARLIAQGVVERAPIHAFCGSIAGQRSFDVIVHVDGPLAIVEAEPAASEVEAPDFYAFATRTVAGLHSALTTVEYCQALTAAIRDLSGYDRVMIYRFDEDWSGHVIAESMVEGKGLDPFLDLHYPASDIPSQARALFLQNTVRLLADAQYTPARLVPETNPQTRRPLDLSHAFLRGASVMYTEYLVNMGVRASLTLAINDRDRLWGLVACHHYSPRRVSYGVRVVCELLSRVASLQITDKNHSDEADYRDRIRTVHAALVEAMASGENVGEVLARQVAAASGFVDCTGTAVVRGNDVHVDGVTPPVEHVRRIATLLAGSQSDTVVATQRLSRLYPEAASFIDRACGLLAVQLSSRLDEYVMWFRPEFVRTVKWAGDPNKPVIVGPMGDRLTPRKSFELWAETVQGASQPWTRLEIESAQRLRTSITEILIRSNQELERVNRQLERSNQELDDFAYAASHDLKEPLRGIYNYAEFLKRDAMEKLGDDDVKKIDSILRLSTRMQTLINSLLEYSRLGRTELRPEAVPLGPLLADAVESLALRMQERNAQLAVIGELPILNGVPSFLEQIFHNLLTNALKYNDKPCVEIAVGAVAAGESGFPDQALGASHALFVQDNGIGITAKHQDNVFKIFKRLHGRDKYGGGTGAGLTIAKRLVERMGGKIWIDSTIGSGTKVWFTLADAGSEGTMR
jgi:chemotaxis family two-component system sensor kinase Cph1